MTTVPCYTTCTPIVRYSHIIHAYVFASGPHQEEALKMEAGQSRWVCRTCATPLLFAGYWVVLRFFFQGPNFWPCDKVLGALLLASCRQNSLSDDEGLQGQDLFTALTSSEM